MELSRLSDVLWSERRLLELLLFKLEEERLVLASGSARWVGEASREVGAVVEEIRTLDVGRDAEASAAAASLGLSSRATLAEIADAAGPPWDDLLHAHRTAFIDLAVQIADVATQNQESLAAALRAAEGVLGAPVEETRP